MFDKKQILPIACDHGGYEMKEYIKQKLTGLGYKIKDLGTFSSDSVDYPDYIHPLAKAVNTNEYKRGIILCGSGNGAQMTANKYQNIRAALCWTIEQTELSRQHNNAGKSVLCYMVGDKELAMEMTLKFLNTEFEGGRHQRRVEKISQII